MSENNNQTFIEVAPPSKIVAQMRWGRFGNIFSNITFTIAIVLIVAMITSVVVPVFYVIILILTLALLIILVFFTVGIILIIPNSPIKIVWKFFKKLIDSKSGELIESISSFCVKMIPYLCYIGIGLSILSIFIFAISRQKTTWRKVLLGIIIVFMMVTLVIYYLLGGQLWHN